MILKKLYRCPKDSLDFRRAIRKIMGGAGEVQKKYSRKGKLNEKNPCTPSNAKKIFMLWPKKNSYKEFNDEKKIPAA